MGICESSKNQQKAVNNRQTSTPMPITPTGQQNIPSQQATPMGNKITTNNPSSLNQNGINKPTNDLDENSSNMERHISLTSAD